MRRAMLVVVMLAGCDRLLRLDDIKPPRDGASNSDGSGDGITPDACMQGPHGCTPTVFAQEFLFPANGLEGFALSPSVTGMYAIVNGAVEASSTFGGSLQASSVAGMWLRIALSPDGNELYVGGTTGMSMATWGGADWSQPRLVPDFPSDGALATPSSSCGQVRMIVKRSNMFEEWARVGGVWQHSGVPPVGEPALTGGSDQISDPSLSTDGLVLTFAVSSATSSSGVWATTRSSLGDSFTTPAVQILQASPPIFTPFISDDCQDLYYEVGKTDLFHWTP